MNLQTRSHFILAVLFVSPLIFMSNAACAAEILDPSGDAEFPDIIGLQTFAAGDILKVIIKCSEPLEGRDISGDVFIDADRNQATEYIKSTGADYVYHFGILAIPYAPLKTAMINDVAMDENAFDIAGDEIHITLPLSILGNPGNNDHTMDLFVATYPQIAGTHDFDRAPNYGTMSTTDGSTKAQAVQATGGFVSDISGDSGSPDIKSLSAEVNNGVLNLAVVYSGNIESSQLSYGDDITGNIFIDSDQDISTGFTNTEEVPPTFGVDYQITYTIGSLLGESATIQEIDPWADLTQLGLIKKETKETVIGIPFNEAAFSVSGDKVFLKVPLGLLGNDDGAMDIIATSFTTNGLLAVKIDRVPDVGALNTADGTNRLPLQCKSRRVEAIDSSVDSPGGGRDGDEMTGVNACLSGGSLLITVGYTSRELDDGAITEIFFDTNQDKAGAEYSLIYYLSSGELQSSLFQGSNLISDTKQLVAISGKNAYLNIPLKLLGNDDGSMNIYVATSIATYGAGSLYLRVGTTGGSLKDAGKADFDRVPDTGVISTTH